MANIQNWVIRLERFATDFQTEIIIRDQDVKPTPSHDLDIKRDYQLILR